MPNRYIEHYVAALGESAKDARPFYRTHGARVAGSFHRARVSSVFQPIVDLSRQSIVGHQGLLRIEGQEADSALAPWNVFARVADDAALRRLDRLCRTLHALNYFSQADEDNLLFLNVEQRLLATVPDNHGRVFKGILAKFGLRPGRVAIMFPRLATEHPWWLERAARNYRSHGYRVLVPASSWDEDTLRVLAGMPIDAVKVNVSPGFNAKRLTGFAAALKERGIALLAGCVETEELLSRVGEVGVDLAQGFVLGRPAALPSSRPCESSGLISEPSSLAFGGSPVSGRLTLAW